MKKKFNQKDFKYYFAGTQMVITILISMFVGYQIDVFMENQMYYITIIFSTASIFYTLYSLIKDVNKEK